MLILGGVNNRVLILVFTLEKMPDEEPKSYYLILTGLANLIFLKIIFIFKIIKFI